MVLSAPARLPRRSLAAVAKAMAAGERRRVVEGSIILLIPGYQYWFSGNLFFVPVFRPSGLRYCW